MDGNLTGIVDSDSSVSTQDSSLSSSNYATDDEIDNIAPPADLTIKTHPNPPVQLEVKKSSKVVDAASLPLISLFISEERQLQKIYK